MRRSLMGESNSFSRFNLSYMPDRVGGVIWLRPKAMCREGGLLVLLK
jgi:hypothetical protein